MANSELPQEILDKIVDTLHDHPSALAACSLAGSSLLHRARSHLFHTITLGPPSEVQVADNQFLLCEKFHALLVSSPNIIPLVRKLVIPDVEGHGNVEVESIEWIYKDALLPDLLNVLSSSFSNLESFVLSGHGGQLLWKSMSSQLQIGILKILQIPSLRHVTFHQFYGYPLSTFAVFKNLEGLKLVTSSPDYRDTDDVGAYYNLPNYNSSDPCCLRSLTITKVPLFGGSPLFWWLICKSASPLNLSGLEKFHFDFRPSPRTPKQLPIQQYYGSVRNFLTQMQTNLETFSFSFDGSDRCINSEFENEIHLKLHLNLRSIVVKVDFLAWIADVSGITLLNHQPFKRIAAILAAAPPSLVTLKIAMVIEYCDYGIVGQKKFGFSELELVGSPPAHWEALDVSLTSSSLRSLRQVQFVLELCNTPPRSDIRSLDLNGALHARLPCLSASGVLLDLVWQSRSSNLPY